MTELQKGNVLHAIAAISYLIFVTALSFIPILFIGLFKLLPHRRWQAYCTRCADFIAKLWCDSTNFYISRIKAINWQIDGLDNLNTKNTYLVIANHQSWLDIVVLHRLFNRKIPTLKFFIKDRLKWIPLLGFSWWAMGCPFMKRYSKEYLAKKPHKKGQDLKATHKAIELFKSTPASIMNFVEGTRYSQQKNQQQDSPYQHLLKPKAGGISFIISAMGEQLKILDVTIIYPKNHKSLWDFLCRRIKAIQIHVRQLSIPKQFASSSLISNNKRQEEFRQWLNDYWHEKDELIARLKLKKPW